ncbi:hypothetical protein Fluta_2616 [Fluviicola taffensis DSM 16823]|uniref:Uncharacterized protein n=1 Tax=Fluviicola taffensis (strain DSM 16823 / NCIMB 13979 / RW262) TaxID=755732 RepID=F2IFB5_FLUTR|nr:hypothetical protein Fluta_2616 [Fluviicola taffensis DSM 16823]
MITSSFACSREETSHPSALKYESFLFGNLLLQTLLCWLDSDKYSTDETNRSQSTPGLNFLEQKSSNCPQPLSSISSTRGPNHWS